MTCSTIGKLRKLFWIIRRPFTMTIQTPAHVEDLRIFRDFNLGHITMTGLTIQPGRDMRPMREMDKIRHLRDGHPGNGLVSFDVPN